MAKIRKFTALVGLVIVWISLAGKVHAQNPSSYYIEDPRTFYAGLIAGANLSQVDGDSYAGYHKVGLNAGGIVYTHLAPNLAVSLEILFSQKGARGHRVQESGAGTFINAYRINLNYAEIPIQLNYFDKRRSHFGGGFSYSQLITAQEKLDTNPPQQPGSSGYVNLENYPFKKSDLNFILGGSLHLWKGLFFQGRFQYSLLSIRKNPPPGYSRSDQFNNMWTLRLMYLF
ncbi:MAG TPA: outer membrane beta-barrel protein [Flavipsychrobacter sp.]|nr:outer membrane beta-barrel protein [Flavipsychrobacter sp.]